MKKIAFSLIVVILGSFFFIVKAQDREEKTKTGLKIPLVSKKTEYLYSDTVSISKSKGDLFLRCGAIKVDSCNNVSVFFTTTDSKARFCTGGSELVDSWKLKDNTKGNANNKTDNKSKGISDFGLRETSGCPDSIAWLIVMDHSSSMRDRRVRMLRKAALVLVEQKFACDAIGMISFSDEPTVEVAMNSDQSAIINSFDRKAVKSGGDTDISAAMNASLDQMAHVDYPTKIIVLVTDGNGPTPDVEQLIKKANREGTKIYAVDFGKDPDEPFMTRLASESGGEYYHLYYPSDFDELFESVNYQAHYQYELDFQVEDTISKIHESELSFTTSAELKYNMQFSYSTFDRDRCFPKEVTIAQPDSIELLKDTVFVVYFGFDRYDISPEQTKQLVAFIAFLLDKEIVSTKVSGHTCDIGASAYNQLLSEKRAASVSNFLSERKFPDESLSIKAFGEDQPAYKNDCNENRQKNRRVEIRCSYTVYELAMKE